VIRGGTNGDTFHETIAYVQYQSSKRNPREHRRDVHGTVAAEFSKTGIPTPGRARTATKHLFAAGFSTTSRWPRRLARARTDDIGTTIPNARTASQYINLFRLECGLLRTLSFWARTRFRQSQGALRQYCVRSDPRYRAGDRSESGSRATRTMGERSVRVVRQNGRGVLLTHSASGRPRVAHRESETNKVSRAFHRYEPTECVLRKERYRRCYPRLPSD